MLSRCVEDFRKSNVHEKVQDQEMEVELVVHVFESI